MTKAQEGYNAWLAAEIQEAIDDPRPSIPHEEVMARMDAQLARLQATVAGKHRKRVEAAARPGETFAQAESRLRAEDVAKEREATRGAGRQRDRVRKKPRRSWPVDWPAEYAHFFPRNTAMFPRNSAASSLAAADALRSVASSARTFSISASIRGTASRRNSALAS